MIKYLDTQVTLREIPDEITLCINLTNCPFKCEGCHSPELREDIGDRLTKKAIDSLIASNEGITCICFMGGDGQHAELKRLLNYIIKKYPNLKTAIYSGAEHINPYLIDSLDYYKYGPYIKELEGLDSPKTNQKLLELTKGCVKNINYKFLKK